MNEVIIESDCLVASASSQKLLSFYILFWHDHRRMQKIVDGVKNKGVSLKFIKRYANNVAHYLARYSCSVADRSW